MTSRYTREIHIPDVAAKRGQMVKRHGLKRQAQSVMYVKDVEAKKQHRVCWCGRHATTEGGMPVHRRLDGASARIAKIKTCGSVWACPVCSAKVAETRREELNKAMVLHIASGGYAYLATLTIPHYFGQSLAELMPMFDKARQRFQSSKGWKKVMDVASEGKPGGTAGRVGSVTSMEVTYGGANGWHPHVHILIFCAPGAFGEGLPDDQGRLQSAAIDYFKGQWVDKLEKAGLVDGQNRQWALQYGLDVRGGQGAAEYIAKWGRDAVWGLSSELTRSHSKLGKRDMIGKKEHYTPFQLLAMSAAGDGHSTCAFREFVNEFDGKRMLTWSRGLKDHFGINDVEDEDAATEAELALNDEHPVGFIDQAQLMTLTKYGRYGEFLAFVAEFCHLPQPQQLIDEWIDMSPRLGLRERAGNIIVDSLKDCGTFIRFVPLEMRTLEDLAA
jgi:hypothetical protein